MRFLYPLMIVMCALALPFQSFGMLRTRQSVHATIQSAIKNHPYLVGSLTALTASSVVLTIADVLAQKARARHWSVVPQKYTYEISKKPRAYTYDNQSVPQVAVLFAHSYDSRENADTLQMEYCQFLGLFPRKDAIGHACKFDDQTSSDIAQKNDVQVLANKLEEVHGEYSRIVGGGFSRGASTLLTLMGQAHAPAVDALVLFAPFDSMRSVVDCFMKYARWIPGLTALANNVIIPFVLRHKPWGIEPRDVIHRIDKNLPILILCSRGDTVVPASSSIAVYENLMQTGHTNVYLWVFEQGNHEDFIEHNIQASLKIVHAFYRRYGLGEEVCTLEDKNLLATASQVPGILKQNSYSFTAK